MSDLVEVKTRDGRGLRSGVDYEVSEATSNVVGFVIVPVGLGILATLAVTARWGGGPRSSRRTDGSRARGGRD